MIRDFILGAIFIASISPAAAQSAREHLPAVNGVAFGSTFDSAQKKLGPGFEAGTAPGNEKIKTLIGRPAPSSGGFIFNYRFGGADGQLTGVYAMDLGSHDFAICRASYTTALNGLIAQFGQPEETSEDIGTQTQVAGATFAFKDGSVIKPLLLGCIVQIAYERTPVKK